MVKLIVIARCIPEDVYLRSLESPINLQLAGEKKFPVVVREPEAWPIGRLANEIKTRYESLYKRQFGQVKYLKDNDDDCDLDPDLTVADLLVDEGKAARDGSDQKKIIKLIQEQGRAIRQGSVIPDLTPSHYQPRTLPPIPRFPGTDRRGTEDRDIDDRPTKRRRLDQIEEETNQVVNSIEQDALSGNLRNVELVVEPKIESPELATTWINTGPATIDELELLPEAPAHFRPRSRAGPSDSRRRQETGPEIRESSVLPLEDRPQRQAAESGRHYDEALERSVRQVSTSHTNAPITPSNQASNTRTPGGQVVTMLNSMKSHSPVMRQSPSRSASRFRKPIRNVYDYPESDIDDTQMSPRSRASRTKITPKLVQTPLSNGKSRTIGGTRQAQPQLPSVVQESPSRRRINGTDAMDVDYDQDHQLPIIQTREQAPSSTKLTSKSLERADRERGNGTVAHHEQQSKTLLHQDRSSILGSDETWSIHEDGTRRKKPRQSRNQRRSDVDVSASRSSSTAASANTTSNTTRSNSGKLKRKRIAPIQVNDRQSRSEFSEMDSPGMQLSETLRRSSPASRPSKEASHNVSVSATGSSRTSNQRHQNTVTEDADMDDIERPPESVSESEEVVPLAKAPKRSKTKGASSQDAVSKEVRCWTCWSKTSLCDNKQPKCSRCMKNKKNCQIFAMNRREFEKEKAKRQAEKGAKGGSSQKPASKMSKAQPRAKMPPQVESNDSADDESVHENSARLDTEDSEKLQSQGVLSPSKSTELQNEDSASEGQTSASSGDESTESNSKPPAPEVSRSKYKKSTDRQQSATESSGGESSSGRDPRTKSRREDVKYDPKDTSTSVEDQQERNRGNINGQSLGGTKPERKTKASPTLHKNGITEDKSPEMTKTLEAAVSVENTHPRLPATPKDALAMPTEKSSTRERSFETRVTSTSKILPMGMTEEEYESLVKSRANLTDEQRKDQKMRNRKLDKRAESTPSLVHQSSTQEFTGKTKQKTPSVQSTQRESSSQPRPRNDSKPPPSTQPTRAPASVVSNTPMSAPAKLKPGPPTTDASSKNKLKLQPASANKGVKIKSPNPPFQPHQPPTKSVAANLLAANVTTPSTLTASRSLKDIRAVLTSQSRSGSGASTPQPARTTAAKIAEMRRGVASAAANARKKITSLSDDDDDDDEESSDEDDEDEDDKDIKGSLGNTAGSAVKGTAVGNVTVRRRTPSDSGSGSLSPSGSSDAQDESGSSSGSGTESASGSDEDDDD